MGEVGAQGGGAVLKPPKLSTRLSAQVLNVLGLGVEQGLLHARIALLLGIEVRGVGRQKVRAEVSWVPLQEALHVSRAVSLQLVPHQPYGPAAQPTA